MSRTPDLVKREQLVNGALAYFAEHGIATTSLRPLAAALGTSDRMLVHYFGSKDALIGEVLVATRPDVDATVKSSRSDLPTMAANVWRSLATGGAQAPRVRLLLQVMSLSATVGEPYRTFAKEATHRWVEALATALGSNVGSAQAEAIATALVSGLRGLALDRFATGDLARTDHAAAVLIKAICANLGPASGDCRRCEVPPVWGPAHGRY